MRAAAPALISVCALISAAGAAPPVDPPLTPDEVRAGPLAPLPPPPDVDVDLRNRGRKLYYSLALAANGQKTCASCHPIDGQPDVNPGGAGDYKVPSSAATPSCGSSSRCRRCGTRRATSARSGTAPTS